MTWYALIKDRIHPILKNMETQKELKRLFSKKNSKVLEGWQKKHKWEGKNGRKEEKEQLD